MERYLRLSFLFFGANVVMDDDVLVSSVQGMYYKPLKTV
jgi:hypothetical protein